MTVTVDTAGISMLSFGFEGAAEGTTDAERVDLVGETEPGVRVQLFRTAIAGEAIGEIQSNQNGTFEFEQVMLAVGDNAFFVLATDRAGNSAQTDGSIYTTAGDTSPPLLSALLAVDSGYDTTDRIANDPTITGAGATVSRKCSSRRARNR